MIYIVVKVGRDFQFIIVMTKTHTIDINVITIYIDYLFDYLNRYY